MTTEDKGASSTPQPRSAAASEPSDADLERGILDALRARPSLDCGGADRPTQGAPAGAGWERGALRLGEAAGAVGWTT